ncbi:MAG: hypothetical protein LQ339_006366 [Xanthoria mediterranea]|nr:MAG: hypothetical protein LQ339_006366 [Xanthoria mediterranea]
MSRVLSHMYGHVASYNGEDPFALQVAVSAWQSNEHPFNINVIAPPKQQAAAYISKPASTHTHDKEKESFIQPTGKSAEDDVAPTTPFPFPGRVPPPPPLRLSNCPRRLVQTCVGGCMSKGNKVNRTRCIHASIRSVTKRAIRELHR